MTLPPPAPGGTVGDMPANLEIASMVTALSRHKHAYVAVIFLLLGYLLQIIGNLA